MEALFEATIHSTVEIADVLGQIPTALVPSQDPSSAATAPTSKLTTENLIPDTRSFLLAVNDAKTEPQEMLNTLWGTIWELEEFFSESRSYRGATRTITRKLPSIGVQLVV